MDGGAPVGDAVIVPIGDQLAAVSLAFGEIGTEYYYCVTVVDGDVEACSEVWTMTDTEIVFGEMVDLSSYTWDDEISFAGELLEIAGIKLAVEEGTACSAHYLSFPLALHCQLALGLRSATSGHLFMTASTTAGILLESNAEIADTTFKAFTGSKFSGLKLPNSDANYFLDAIAGTDLLESRQFPETGDAVVLVAAAEVSVCLSDILNNFESAEIQDDNFAAQLEWIMKVLF